MIKNKYVLVSRTACLHSLLQSIHKAGGAISGFTIDRLKEMSAMELIEILGLNNIYFTFDNPEFNTEEKECFL
ncbi:MAG: hypothetical protein PVG39_00495 [Desulfobacteraceae bacterium]|jgi:hypothetical protein